MIYFLACYMKIALRIKVWTLFFILPTNINMYIPIYTTDTIGAMPFYLVS